MTFGKLIAATALGALALSPGAEAGRVVIDQSSAHCTVVGLGYSEISNEQAIASVSALPNPSMPFPSINNNPCVGAPACHGACHAVLDGRFRPPELLHKASQPVMHILLTLDVENCNFRVQCFYEWLYYE
ncbi:MAG: hypothetical protein HC767_14195 [Akkermansiaceae bacterium]|nr:hypothetical protein [Akkermansiaceae bacterium]